MGISFNPKQVANDIAKGLVYLNPTRLKKYSAPELKELLSALSLVQREIRAQQIPVEETLKMQEKNRHLHNINQAISLINGYVKKYRIRL